MITKKEFEKIDKEVRDSLDEVFEVMRNHCREGNYVLFLADGDYTDRKRKGYSPYVINDMRDWYNDETRLSFFTEFMTKTYSFAHGAEATTDDDFRRNIELMIYAHVWESKTLLKQLYRLAQLMKNDQYIWHVEVPEQGKQDFIRNDIRQTFEDRGLKISDIIKKGFHSSLRNAFAHSQYSFNDYNKVILLDNYKGGAWELKEISYDDWTKRFAYTAFLSYHFINYKHQKRLALPDDLKKNQFQIIQPISATQSRAIEITYHQEHNSFSFNS